MFLLWGNLVNDVGSTKQDILSYAADSAFRFSSVTEGEGIEWLQTTFFVPTVSVNIY
jgi:hypothetical protein